MNLEIFTVKEVAEMLRMSAPMMYKYIKEGKIKAVKAGTWKITKEDLEKFLKLKD